MFGVIAIADFPADDGTDVEVARFPVDVRLLKDGTPREPRRMLSSGISSHGERAGGNARASRPQSLLTPDVGVLHSGWTSRAIRS